MSDALCCDRARRRLNVVKRGLKDTIRSHQHMCTCTNNSHSYNIFLVTALILCLIYTFNCMLGAALPIMCWYAVKSTNAKPKTKTIQYKFRTFVNVQSYSPLRLKMRVRNNQVTFLDPKPIMSRFCRHAAVCYIIAYPVPIPAYSAFTCHDCSCLVYIWKVLVLSPVWTR